MRKAVITRSDGTTVREVPYTPARLFDLRGRELAAYRGDTFQVARADFSPDGKYVVTVESNYVFHVHITPGQGWGDRPTSGDHGPTAARIYEARSGRLLAVLRDPPAPGWERRQEQKNWRLGITAAAISPDGRQAATIGRVYVNASATGVHLWELPSGKLLRALDVGLDHGGGQDEVCWSPDGQRILLRGGGGAQVLVHAQTGTRIALPDVTVVGGPFSPDGGRLAGAGPGSSLQVHDSATGKVVAVGKGHRQRIHSLAFSADGRRIATAAFDGTARVWDSATGAEVLTLAGQRRAGAAQVMFSPDNGRVLTAGYDGSVRVWELGLLPIAEARKPRELTAEERERYEIRDESELKGR
jgi:WD40 repeat protein